MDGAVVGDVVPVVTQRRRVERQEPYRGDAEILEVVQLGGEAGEVADAVRVRIVERSDVELVDDGVAIPLGVRCVGGRLGDGRSPLSV
jgi:hypothetical protein